MFISKERKYLTEGLFLNLECQFGETKELFDFYILNISLLQFQLQGMKLQIELQM